MMLPTTALLPSSSLLPLLVLAGVFMACGVRGLSVLIVVLVLWTALSPLFDPLINTVLNVMPWWFPILMLIGVVLALTGSAIRDIVVQIVADLITCSIQYLIGSPRLIASIFGVGALLWLLL